MTVKKIASTHMMNGIVHVQRIAFLVDVNQMKMEMSVSVAVRATKRKVVILFVNILL